MNATMAAGGLAKVLLVAGGVLFFFGDSALRRIWGVSLVPAEVYGIGGGVLLMMLGAFLQFSWRRETAREEQTGMRDAGRVGR